MNRRLLGQALAHPHTGAVHLDTREARVRASEVEELEDAERAAVVLRDGLRRTDAAVVCNDELARTQLALEVGADEIERARLGRDDPVVAELAEAERPHAARVAKGHERAFGEKNDGERAVESQHRVRRCVGERRGVVRDQRGDHLAVGRGRQAVPGGSELRAQLGCVREVAVVPERDGSRRSVLHEWLRVPPLRRPGRRVARVPDRELAAQSSQLLLVEDLRDEAHVAQRSHAALIGDRDACGFLTAVLQREQAEVRDARDVSLGRPDAEEAAHQSTVPICTTFFLPSRSTFSGAQASTTCPERVSAGRWTSAPMRLWPAASCSATSSPPSDTSCASERNGATFQTYRTSAASAARSRSPGAVASRTTSPERHAPGTKRTSWTRPTQPTTGVGGIDRPSVSL